MRRLGLALLVLVADAIGAAGASVEDLRRTCEEITNRDHAVLDGFAIGERKPALLHFVRRKCEGEELLWDLEKKVSPAALAELRLIRRSLVERQRVEAGIGIIGILGMGLSHDLSPFILRVKREPLRPLPLVESSPFWSEPKVAPEDAFAEQMKKLAVSPPGRWLRADKLEGKGSVPKLHARDISGGARWLLKWGDEAHSDPVASRIFAGLGYNVDFPFSRSADGPRLILGRQGKKKRTVQQLVNFIFNSYRVNLSPFIAEVREISSADIESEPSLAPFLGESYLSFRNFSLEARPALETRLGPFLLDEETALQSLPVRAALLAHLWVGNWDTKSDNSLLSVVTQGRTSALRASFSDLGVSLGVELSKFPRDLKAGMVNAFSARLVDTDGDEVRFLARMNHHPPHWREPRWNELRWMAQRISLFSQPAMEKILGESGWPTELQQNYLLLLGKRRRQLLEAFEVEDPHPWRLEGPPSELTREYDLARYPQGLFHSKGRFRGYGW